MFNERLTMTTPATIRTRRRRLPLYSWPVYTTRTCQKSLAIITITCRFSQQVSWIAAQIRMHRPDSLTMRFHRASHAFPIPLAFSSSSKLLRPNPESRDRLLQARHLLIAPVMLRTIPFLLMARNVSSQSPLRFAASMHPRQQLLA